MIVNPDRRHEQIMDEFPGRRFLLVGDSGERDPEVYTSIARRHPGQVRGVIIRRVTGHMPEAKTSRRLERLARRLPRGEFRVFTDPDEIRKVFVGPLVLGLGFRERSSHRVTPS